MVENAAAMALHTERMRRVINDFKLVPRGDCLNRIHITRVTVNMNRHDGSGVGCDGCLYLCGVEV